jgi:3-hydroxybutyryl-CoA dehydratase
MVDYDSDLISRVFEGTVPVLVTAQMVADFCYAIGETNPIYLDAEAARRGPYGVLVAPLSFAGSFRYLEDIFDHIRASPRLAAGMDVDFLTPIRVGDAIRVSSHVEQIYEKTGRSGPMVFILIRSTLTNQDGDLVARVDHRFMSRP